MKWWIYLFALVNLVIFLWHYQPGQFSAFMGAGRPKAVEDETSPRLVLLKEYETHQQQKAHEATPPAEIGLCYRLGPFTAKGEARAILKQLQATDIQAKLQVNKDQTRPGYWVLLPPTTDRKGARQTVEWLKEKQVKDFFLVATGAKKNAISLGVFSRSELARKRLKEVQGLGFRAVIEKVELPKREYWLEWAKAKAAAVPLERLETWRKKNPEIGQTEQKCSVSP